jgi:hypothetical protein
MRGDGRRADELRPLEIQTDFLEQPHGCVLYRQGKTRPLHGDGRGGSSALVAQERARLDDCRVRDAAGLDR